MNSFLKEILEQPESISSTLSYYLSGEGNERLQAVRALLDEKQPRQIVFTGMGSSYFSSYAASCLFNSLGIRSYALNTSELLHYHFAAVSESDAVVCVSQSGESYEVAKLLEMLPDDILCVGVSNEDKSRLTERARGVLLSRAGKEEMTSTKTYTTITLVMFILGWYLGNVWGEEKIREIRKLAAGIEGILSNRGGAIAKILNFFGEIEFLQFIGRGPSFSTALQGELMFKEAAKVPAAGTSGGEFRHGPMEMVGNGFNAVLFGPEGVTYEQSVRMAMDIAKYDGKVLLVTNKGGDDGYDKNIKVIVMNQADEYLFSVQSILPVQLMVNDLALARGHEPGAFLHGTKVTRTE